MEKKRRDATGYVELPLENSKKKHVRNRKSKLAKTFTKKAHAVAKGTGIIFIGTIIGTIIGMLLGFACRAINFIFIYTMLRLGGVRDVHNCVKRRSNRI